MTIPISHHQPISDEKPAVVPEGRRSNFWPLTQGGQKILVALLISICLGVIATPWFPASFTPQSFVYPVMAPRMSSGYGMRIHPIRRFSKQHDGIDLAAPMGSPIRAIAPGRVVFADPYAGYGNFVVIQHDQHLTSHYGHCHELRVKTGQKVSAGQIIAYVGSTGMSTGPHLHFEIRKDGVPLDPEKLIPGLASEAEG